MDPISAVSTLLGKVIDIFAPRFLSRKEAQDKTILRYGMKISILTCDGLYVMNDREKSNQLFARSSHVNEWEFFEIVSAQDVYCSIPNQPVKYGDSVAFRALNLDPPNFVSARLDQGSALVAWVRWVKGWEKFTLQPYPTSATNKIGKVLRYGTDFSIIANNGKFVMYNRDNDKSLSAVSERADEWEKFTFIDPANPK